MAAGARCVAPTARSSCFGVERYAVFHPLTLTAELRFDNGKTNVFPCRIGDSLKRVRSKRTGTALPVGQNGVRMK